MTRRYFVTATGTDIGKTFVTATLATAARQRGLTVRAVKPLVTGFTADDPATDTAILLAAQGLRVTEQTIAACSPWRWRAPLSPDMAALREGGALEFTALLKFCETALAGPQALILIEGVGGVMSPIARAATVLDWATALNIAIILVAGTYLGTISHTLTALRVAAMANLTIAALVLDESPQSPVPIEETAAAIYRFAPDTNIILLPRQTAANRASIEDHLLRRLL